MKKNFLFKLVSVLGAVLLLANTSLPGLQVFADSASPEMITTANCNIIQPVGGETVITSAVVPDGANYSCNFNSVACTSDNTNRTTLTNSEYIAGQTCEFRVTFAANDGYTFAEGDSTTYTINNTNVAKYGNYQQRSIQYVVSTPATPVCENEVTYGGSNTCDTLANAISNASAGDTITLMKDLEASPAIDGKNIILDLGGHNLTVNGWGLDVYASTLVVKNGTISTNGNVGVYLNYGNNFTLDSTAKIIGTGVGITSDLYPQEKTDTNIVVIDGEIDVYGSAIFVSAKSTLTVNNGAKVEGENGILIGEGAGSSNVTVNGYVGGSNVGITINGNITSTTEYPTITVGSNTEIVTNGDETVGLYLAGYGKTTIADGAKISGTAGAIEIRAGELTVNGGIFTSTADSFSITPNGNGSTTVGAAVAVSQHTTNSPINVVINGGTFDGVKALHEEDIQNEVATGDISISVTNGIFNGEVSSENITRFIKGGIFKEKPDINYILDGYSVYKNNESKYVVTTTAAAEKGAAEATVAPDPVVAAETTFTTGATEDFSAGVPAEDSSIVEQKLPDVAGDSATYTLVVDTQETIQKVDESGDTTTTMTGVKESELRSSADKTPEIKGGAEVYIQKADGTSTGRNIESVEFTKPVAIPIFVGKSLAGQSVFVKVKHATGGSFGIDGLVTDGTNCAAVATSTPSITVGANGFVIVYTCKASTFVAYTETANQSSSSSSSTSGGGGGGGSSSYSCKSLPANAVANNTSKPKKNTNYSYSTDTGAVCTFQCKSGYTWNEKDEKCEKSEETVADTDKQDTEKVESDATDTDNETSDTTSEDLKKVLDDGYTVEFHNAYDFAFKNGITTMPSIEEAHMNSPLTRIAMAKMLSQYAINVLGKKPANVVVPNFPDVSPELDAEYNNGVTLAYQLGIMGINIENFRPDDLVTRAEFATALSRLLYNTPDGEGAYYETHLKKLMEEKVITVADPDMHELRGYVMIMLMRSAKNS